jgi:hypothetical protein
VQSVIGSDAQTATAIVIPAIGFTLNGCVWTSKDGTLTVALGPKNLDKTAFDTAMKSTSLMTPVSGVGDSAYSFKLDVPQGMAGAAGIVAVKNGQYFTIQVAHKSGSSASLLQVITDLAKTMAGKLQ